MAIHWQVKFKSLRAGTDYTVSIYDDTYTGNPVQLMGAADPFTTEEDNDEDMFTPIRTQSGYLRIVDNGYDANGNAFNWKDLLPATDTDRPVILTSTTGQRTNTLWQGFMQAQNFSGKLYGNPQVREFPIQCVLAALSASDVDPTNRELKNFAYIIKQAFDNIVNAGVTISNYIFQGGASAQAWLMKLVDWQNMMMSIDDGLSGKYDNQRVINDVCKFWGWTARVNGKDVIFSCADDTIMTTALVLTQANLNILAGGTAAGTTSDTFLSDVTLSGDIFASVNQDDFRVRGYSKAMVTADGNPGEKGVIGFAPPSVEKIMREQTSYNEQDGDKIVYYTGDLTEFTSDYENGSCRSGYATFNIADIRDYGSFSDAGDSSDVIRIKKSFSSASAQAYASLQSVFHHSLYDANSSLQLFNTGGLSLKGKIYHKATQFDDHKEDFADIGNKSMYMRVGIGKTRATAKWWTGTSWSSTESAFKVALGNTDEKLYIISQSGSGGHQSTNYNNWIPTNEANLFGLIFVEFLGSDDMPEENSQRSFDIHDFSLEFVRSSTVVVTTGNVTTHNNGNFGGAKKYRVIERAGSREYVSKNQNKVRDEWNADCIYSSDNDMEFGYGVIMNTDGSQMGKITYNNTESWPEQHLADRVSSYWSSAKRMLSLEVRTEAVPTVTPRNTVTVDGTTCYAIAISHEWRDDVTQLTLMQL